MNRKPPALPGILIVAGGFLVASRALSAAPAENIVLKYFFGPQPPAGYTRVKPEDTYNVSRGYGFDLGSKVQLIPRENSDPLGAGFVTGVDGRPFFFSAKLNPGVYRVSVALGDMAAESVTTVKSETRRLMLERVRLRAGQGLSTSFLVHVRVPRIRGGGVVALKAREKEPILNLQWDENDDSTRTPFLELNWDEKLTLEFSDEHPALLAIDIVTIERPTTVYLVGDSTVTDQMMEPWGGWGQMLPRWLKPPVVVANYAESGESARSFVAERRWEKLMSEIRAGDFVLIQFGINDRNGTTLDQFKEALAKFVRETRDHGATPVLVTPQNLRRLDDQGRSVQTLDGFPDAMRAVAREQKTALLDLNAASMELYQAIGAANLPSAFVDDTHQNSYGAYELAKCVVTLAVAAKLPWTQALVNDWKPFDPAHPDSLEAFTLPRDPQLDPARPGGAGVSGRRRPMAGDVPRSPATQSSQSGNAPSSSSSGQK